MIGATSCTAVPNRPPPFGIASHLSLERSERKPLGFHLAKSKMTCSGEPGWPIWRPIRTIGPIPPVRSSHRVCRIWGMSVFAAHCPDWLSLTFREVQNDYDAGWYPKAFPGVEKDLRSHLSTCVCTHVVAARSEEPRNGSIELTAPHCGEIRKAMGTKTRSSAAGMEAGKARRPQHDRSRGACRPSWQAGETDERSGGLTTT